MIRMSTGNTLELMDLFDLLVAIWALFWLLLQMEILKSMYGRVVKLIDWLKAADTSEQFSAVLVSPDDSQ